MTSAKNLAHKFKSVGLSPRDGTPDTDISTVLVPVAVILIIFDIGGLAFALICLVFNLYHRDKK